MFELTRIVLVDTGFWYALFSESDQHHRAATDLITVIDSSTLLLPWPCLYETLNTRFVKNARAIRQFESLIRQPRVIRIPDEPYREDALNEVIKTAATRKMALVDMVIRFILADTNVRKTGFLTFNKGDFADRCHKHNVEML